jgi:alkylation response protein AidB-like acyl-CoA dehydrogenase
MSDAIESVEDFAARAGVWLAANLPAWDEGRLDDVTLQNRIYDAGFGGIAFPREYGGLGLTLEHQKAFYDAGDELDRQVPGKYWVSIGMVAPTILERGSEAAKQRWLRTLLRGDIVCIQLLSEPRGGSDMAGATTRLTRDGDSYLLNGAKMWSTNAYLADFGLCLARSDWDAPKHQGLSMIMVPLKDSKGVTLKRTRMATGEVGDVCEEFFDDVLLPAENLVGEENDGWSVAQTLLFHERNQTSGVGYGYLGGSGRPYTAAARRGAAVSSGDLVGVARQNGLTELHAQAVADLYVNTLVGNLTSQRIMRGMARGTHKGPWGSLAQLQRSTSGHRASLTRLAVFGAEGVTWDGDEVQLDNVGTAWLTSRVATIGGGTTEMQRNIVSERLLDLPREPSLERGIPFSDVLRNATKM